VEVGLVLVGVGFGEVGHRLGEPVATTEVGGNGNAVPGAGVRPCQGPAAHAGVGAHAGGHHALDLRRALPVAQLAHVEVARLPVNADRLAGAEEDVGRGLHQVLPLHDSVALVVVRR